MAPRPKSTNMFIDVHVRARRKKHVREMTKMFAKTNWLPSREGWRCSLVLIQAKETRTHRANGNGDWQEVVCIAEPRKRCGKLVGRKMKTCTGRARCEDRNRQIK